jgi:PAS domain S-box-containing protein
MNEVNSNAVLNQVTEPMIVVDWDGNIIFFNEGLTRYEYLARQQFKKGMPLVDVVSADRKEIFLTMLRQVKTNHIPVTSEAEYKDARGRSVFFEVTFSPVMIEGNEPEQICILLHEITHQKTFERRSVELIQQLSNLIENANAFIFSVDSREYITEWNKECARITNYEKNEVLAQKVYQLLDTNSHQGFATLMQKVLQGIPVSNQELIIRNRDGRSVTALVNATPRLNPSQNVVGVLLVGQDMTELFQYRNHLEEEIKDRTSKLAQAIEKEKELVALKNRFVSVASHEFRIPLSSVGASVNSLKKSPALRQEDHDHLVAIEHHVVYMKKLLDDILTVKRAENHGLKAVNEPLDLVRLLQTMVQEVCINAGYSHSVVTFFSQPVIMIESDERLLRNVFLNLLSNAMKFSPGKKEVGLSASIAGNNVCVEVSDHGIGIPQADLEKIFDPFERASNATDINGTGLGLSIVKRAVETLGGTITVDSVQHTGTKFSVNLNIPN